MLGNFLVYVSLSAQNMFCVFPTAFPPLLSFTPWRWWCFSCLHNFLLFQLKMLEKFQKVKARQICVTMADLELLHKLNLLSMQTQLMNLPQHPQHTTKKIIIKAALRLSLCQPRVLIFIQKNERKKEFAARKSGPVVNFSALHSPASLYVLGGY